MLEDCTFSLQVSVNSYHFSLVQDFLRIKAYPLLEGCVAFLLDWLIEGHEGYLETNPSTSPEHYFIAPDGKRASVSNSSTMDMAIIKELFSAIISAAEVEHSSPSHPPPQTPIPSHPPSKLASTW